MTGKFITALPVYNEAHHVARVLDEVTKYSDDVVVVNDGSTDGTAELLAKRSDVIVVNHSCNRGYGAALRTAFGYASAHDYDVLVTIDCDGQHEPQRIPRFVNEIESSGSDIVSGSRYLEKFDGDSTPPEQRRAINFQITKEMNEHLGFNLTDAFCGFKAYRVDAVKKMKLTDDGYAMPLELWVQAACLDLKIVELPVPLIYLDEKRSFGGSLDDGQTRLNYYHEVISRSVEALPKDCSKSITVDFD